MNLIGNRRLLCVLTMLAVLAFALCCTGGGRAFAASEVQTQEITDLAGRTVKVPVNPTRVAALVGPAMEKLILLGQTDKVVIAGVKRGISGWAAVVDPRCKNLPVTEKASEPNIEELIEKGVQVVFFWSSYPEMIAKMEQAGIAVVITQLGSGNPKSREEFVRFQKDEVNLIAKVMGGGAVAKADKWCKYFDQKVKYVCSRTDALSEKDRPDVYYVRGPEALNIHGRNSYTAWLVEMAGGNLVSRNSKKEGLYMTTMEEAVKWNAEYIFMGRVNNIELVTKDPAWSAIRAVKEKKVFVNPEGVFFWDYDSEGFLLMEFVAKNIHPKLFKDLDMKREIKDYYRKFYNYALSDDEVTLILQHKAPAK